MKLKVVKKFSFLFFFMFCFLACAEMSPKEKELDALYRTVMSIHDDVMPEISTIRKLHKQIRKHDNAESAGFQNMLTRLDKEDDGMMDWMKQFDKPDYKQYDESKKYLLKEKIKIERVREGMLGVIEDAQTLLKDN